MYTMPRSFPRSKKWIAPVSAFALLLLVFFVGVDTSAQKKRPATKPKTQQQGAAGANANTQTAQQKPQKKNITPLKSGDTSDGSRITITSDAPLNDYSAYRSGDRYYVVIPEANAPRAQGGLRGRGFEDVQVQKRGNDAILSFKLQPGTNARVSQRFNRLDVELTAPGGTTAAVPTSTPKPATTPTPQPTPQTIARPTPQTATTGNANQTTTQPVAPGGNNPDLTQPATGGNPAIVYAPTPPVSASPGASPEANPVATPPTEQIAQAQPPSTSQPATTSAPATTGTTFGTVLRQNWLVILIAAVVLLSLLMIVAARSRARSTAVAATPARKTSRKERREAQKASARLAEADLAEAAISSEVTAPKYKTATLPKAVPVKSVPAVIAAAAVAGEAIAPVVEETKEIEVAPAAVDVELAETEVGKVLAGGSYDETVIGSSDAGTRALVATGLLAALAARNVEHRERAREAFIKHDYLDEATRQLRTAEAPAERAAAARSLGYVQDKATTLHLVVALEDEAPEVRRAAVESLAELRDPAALQPLKSLLKRERDRKVSRSLIKRAIEASAAVEEEETTTLTAAAPAPETETVTLEAPPVIGQADVASIAETETPTLEAEAPAIETEQPTPAALAEISPAHIVPDTVALVAPPLVTEEVDTEAEEAARREAEEEAARQQAEEERLRVEAEAQRQAEEDARLAAEAKAEEERRQAAEEEARKQAEEAARLKAEEEANKRAIEEEERRQAEEAARLKAEEELRLAAEAEAAERRKVEEEAARLRAEEEERQRVAAEERRQADEVAARLKLEQEAARQRAEEKEALRLEEERRAEEERLRLEEEARQRAVAEQKRAEEEAARLRAAEEERRQQEEAEKARKLAAEAEAQRKAEEEARLAAEAEEQRRAEEERARQVAAEEAAAAATLETLTAEELPVVKPVDYVIERNDETTSGWVELDMSDAEIVRYDEPVTASPVEETTAQSGLLFAEPVVEESKELEPSGLRPIEEPAAKPVSKEIDFAVTEKGVAEFDEFSSVPGAILKRLSSESTEERASAVADLARVGSDDSFREISAAFDDPAVEVRNAAARSLFSLNADRAATFTRALRESPPERRRKIGAALASSGLASEAIGQLMGESREKTYDAFSLLFLMSKAGEVQPLMRAIEEHPNNEVRLAVVKLLALSGQQEILPAFRRLAVRGSLPTEVRSAVMEAIYQISSQSPTPA